MANELLDAVAVRTLLREHIARRYGTMASAARAWGVTASFVSLVLRGGRPPTAVMLADLGLERTVLYRRIDEP